MALNESKGNMYSWITHTWNTVKGECPHGCTYCYMKRWGKQKPLHFDESELKTDLGKGNFVFVGSSCDLFAELIPSEWIEKTLVHCGRFDNKYLLQTKNPNGLSGYNLPENFSICTTIETNRRYPQMEQSPVPEMRANSMYGINRNKKYVTIEPIMDFDLKDMVEMIKVCNPVQVNVGADSGNNLLPEPPKDKLLALIDELKKFTVIDRKTNLGRLLK